MRTLQFNTQERALSTDVNRLQKFKERDVMELLRMWLTSRGTWEDSAGVGSDPQSAAAPSYAEIINGLTPHPIDGTFGMVVDPGVAVIVDAAQPDGSAAQYVRDNGVSASAPLAVTPNGTLFVRFDYLECALAAAPETVSDSRDVFDPTTGFFTAASLVKESQVRLQYRVRAGTAGAGLPAADVGWLPLCVIRVPNGAVNLDTCTLWDVRPLLSDRAEAGVLQAAEADGDGLWLDISGPMTAAKGNFRVKHGGRWLGGKLRRGSPGTDNDYVDFSDTSNGSTAGGANLWTVYAALLGGLPRWCRYSDQGSGTRSPRACRGILVQSDIRPNSNGTPQSAITVPGLGTTLEARSIWNGFGVATNAWVHAHGRTILVNNFPGFPGGAIANGVFSPGLADYTITLDTQAPRTAKHTYVQVNATMTINAGGDYKYEGNGFVTLSGAIQYELNAGLVTHPVACPNAYVINFIQPFKVPMLDAREAAINTVPSATTFYWNSQFAKLGGGTPPTVNASYYFVTGWEV